jgi:hypothetical protein
VAIAILIVALVAAARGVRAARALRRDGGSRSGCGSCSPAA